MKSYPVCALITGEGKNCFAFLDGRCRILDSTSQYFQEKRCPFFKSQKQADYESAILEKKVKGSQYEGI